MGGGGQGLYERLLHDSTENLLKPTAAMIGNANRLSMSNYSSQAWATTATGINKKRQLMSANIRHSKPNRVRTVTNNYNDASSRNMGAGPQRAYSSGGARTSIHTNRRPLPHAMYISSHGGMQ